MTWHKAIAIGGTCIVGAASLPASAVEKPKSVMNEVGIGLGAGLRLYPAIETNTVYDTNFFFAPDESRNCPDDGGGNGNGGDGGLGGIIDGLLPGLIPDGDGGTNGGGGGGSADCPAPREERDTFGLLARPSLRLVQEGSRSRFELGTRMEIAEWEISEQDDYFDANYFASGQYRLASRHRVSLRGQREDGHDPFGLRRTEEATDVEGDRELDEYTQDTIDAGYVFGADRAFLQLEYGFLYTDKTYDTNRFVSDTRGTRFLDFQADQHTGIVRMNVSPKTALLLEGEVRDNTYPNNAPGQIPRDSTQYRLKGGVNWRALSKVGLRALVGYLDHRPDDDRRDDFTGVDWEVQLDYAVSAKTLLTLNTQREVRPSFQLDAEFINTRIATVGWTQRWGPRVRSSLSVGYQDLTFEGGFREDEFFLSSLGGTYILTRDLAIIASVSLQERESNLPFRDFTKELVTLGIQYRR